jgi:hypothetical protein
MPKPGKNPKPRTLTAQESAYTLMPWSCHHYPDYSEIEAYNAITGEWEVIADIHDTKGVDAKVVAGLVARAVNGYPKHLDMIGQMAAALELCLGRKTRLSLEAEHEALMVLDRAREMERGDRAGKPRRAAADSLPGVSTRQGPIIDDN